MKNEDMGPAFVDVEVADHGAAGTVVATKHNRPMRFVHHETGFAGSDFVPGQLTEVAEARKDPRLRALRERADYVSNNQNKVIQKALEERINATAKRVWESYKDRLELYYAAANEYATYTEAQKDDPTRDQAAVIAKVANGPPMTKERALAIARDLVTKAAKRGA